ncbi:MAG: APC family permease [Bacteroidota bacterium]
MENKPRYTRNVAISMVIANMIGTGVFTSLGYQVGTLPSGFTILFLWFLGGVIALCGAFTYAEISTTIKGSGGEYNYLSQIYHPSVGFLSGWMSLIVGFAAPVCAVAIAIGNYFSPVIGVEDKKAIAVVFILVIAAVHLFGVKVGGKFQNYLTLYKILLIVVFCLIPFFITGYEPSGISFGYADTDYDLIFSSGFAVSLAFIMYAYSGWNASTYIAGVMENPKKNLPFSLITGTAIVTLLYVALNAVFLYVGTFQELGVKPPNFDEVDVGNVVAFKIFGNEIGVIFAALITFALVSSLSAMTIAGPRVVEQMGNDYPVYKKVAMKTESGAPYLAIFIQAAIAIAMVMVSSFEEIIKFIAISLSLFSTLTVAGVFILRIKKKTTADTFKTWGFPVTPLLFIAANSWMMYYIIKDALQKQAEGKTEFNIFWLTLLVMLPGIILYFIAAKTKKNETV